MTARKRASFSFRGAGSGHRSRAQQSEEDNGAFSGEVADEDTGDHDGLLFSKVPKSFTFWRRCAGLLQSVMRTRTAFSAFLSSFLHVSRSDMAPISTLFPLPVPEVGMFQRMPANLPPSLPPSLALSLSLSLSHSLSLSSCTEEAPSQAGVAYHCDGAEFLAWRFEVFPQREPFVETTYMGHEWIFCKLMSLIAVDGPDSGALETLACGRKFPQLHVWEN